MNIALTPTELQVMQVLWASEEPLSCAQITARSPEDKLWKDRSIYGIIKVLLTEKQVVRERGAVKNELGKYIAVYEPAVSSDEYYAQSFSTLKQKDIPLLFSALVGNEDLNDDIIKELEDILDAKKKGR